MNRFALLPPDIQALERRRHDLSRRIGFLSPGSQRGRALRREQAALTRRIVALELDLAGDAGSVTSPGKPVTDASLAPGDSSAFKRRYWWVEL